MARPTGQRTITQTVWTAPSSSPMSRPNASRTKATAKRKPTLSASRNARAVLLERRAVPLDPVDPVDTPLDLPECRRRRDQGADEPEHERQVAVMRAHLVRLLDRVGEEVAGQPGHGVLDRVDDHAAELEVAERGGEADERDQPLDEDERHHERERAGVAEAVGVAQPSEASATSRRRPVSSSVLRASSPVSSHVSGTRVAVLIGLPGRRSRSRPARSRSRTTSPSRGRRRRARRAPSGRARPRSSARG